MTETTQSSFLTYAFLCLSINFLPTQRESSDGSKKRAHGKRTTTFPRFDLFRFLARSALPKACLLFYPYGFFFLIFSQMLGIRELFITNLKVLFGDLGVIHHPRAKEPPFFFVFVKYGDGDGRAWRLADQERSCPRVFFFLFYGYFTANKSTSFYRIPYKQSPPTDQTSLPSIRIPSPHPSTVAPQNSVRSSRCNLYQNQVFQSKSKPKSSVRLYNANFIWLWNLVLVL